MIKSILCFALACAFGAIDPAALLGQTHDTPQSRMRPIGSPSLVDQYRTSTDRQLPGVVPFEPSVRQAAWMQNVQAPPLPGEEMDLPGTFAPPPVAAPPAAVPMPPATTRPRSLPINPTPPGAAATPDDYAPLIQPRLGDPFATLDNSCHVSGPSSYTAASASGCCAPVGYVAQPAYVPPPATIPGPAVPGPGVPGAATPGIMAPATTVVPGAVGGAPAGALISFGQDQYPVQVGPGWFGQPVAYVPGQKFRNWLRYLFP